MKRVLVLLTATVFLLTACASPVKPFPTVTNDASNLAWKTCNQGFQCATLKVPIDYDDQKLGTFDIAVIRYRDANQHDRIGSLVINPGGPGVSGIDYALNAQYILNPDVLERYDIVGFDPRGTGRSSPITCLNSPEQDEFFSSDPKPDSRAEFVKALTQTQNFVNKCLAKTEFLEYYSTRNAALDMELLRQGLGDKKLNYMGFSYGTYLGTLYAQRYPQKVGRFVLDGAIHPSMSISQQMLVQAAGFDQALKNFITDCSHHKNCPLPPSATPQFFTDLFDRVSTQPLASTVGENIRSVTEALVVTGTAAALYENESGWPLLRIAIEEALAGNGTTFAKLADGYNGRNSDGTYHDNQNDANIIIDCLDWHESYSNEYIRTHARKYATVAPVFGPYLAYSGVTCNFLNEAINRTVITTDQNTVQIQFTATPILIIGTTQDPATPYVWAQALNRYIKGSRLVTFHSEGHTGYGRGSACVDDAVDKYLTTGAIPPKNLICRS